MTATAGVVKPSPYAVFRSPAFRLLWIGQFISTAGSALSMLASSILVFRVTGSALSVGLMLIVTVLPSLVVGLVAGVIVDRYDRKRVMIAADLSRAVLVGVVPLFVLGAAGFHVPGGIVWLYILATLAGVGTQFFDPAFASVLPEVASDDHLAAANSLMQISSFGSNAIGFAGAGLIASQLPIAWAFYLDALSFLISATCVALAVIPRIAATDTTSVAVVYQNLRSGARYLFASRVLRSLFVVSIPAALGIGLSNALLLPFAVRALHATSFQYSLQEGLTSVGFVAGSLLLASRADRIQAGQLAAIGFLGMGLTTAIYAGLSSIWVALVVMVVSGFFNAPSAVARGLEIQRYTSREVRGRVFSAFFVVRDLLVVVGMAAAGLADIMNVRLLYLIVALVLLVSAGLYALMPGLRQSAAEWRHLTLRLRAAGSAPGIGAGRVPGIADLDLLAGLLPPSVSLSTAQRELLATDGRIYDVGAHAAVIRQGETSDNAYFILHGRVAVGRAGADSASDTPLAILNQGDFFGEIAALTAAPRTANVVTDDAATLLEVPAATLRQLMHDPDVRRLLVSTMTARLAELHMIDLPRYAALSPAALAELRASAPGESIARTPVAAPSATTEAS